MRLNNNNKKNIKPFWTMFSVLKNFHKHVFQQSKTADKERKFGTRQFWLIQAYYLGIPFIN